MNAPWTPYLEQHHPQSASGITLVEAYTQLSGTRWGAEAGDIYRTFVEYQDDDGEEGASICALTLVRKMMTEAFLTGSITTFARPLKGGIPEQIPPSLWEIDDPVQRFSTGCFNLPEWANPDAELTHRIFVDQKELKRHIDDLYTQDEVSRLVDGKRVARDNPRTQSQTDEQSQAETTVLEAQSQTETHIIRLPAVQKLTGISRTTIYQKMNQGCFPEKVKLGPRGSGWFEHEVIAWMNGLKRG